MFNRQSLERFCSAPCIVETVRDVARQNFVYARVSNRNKLADISRQLDIIRSKNAEYASYTTITDVASGLNFKRKGLDTILESCLQGTIGEIVIAHRDRLCRFGFELLEILVEKSGGKITVLDNDGNKSSEQELSEDLLSIVHIYSCKQMGKRSYKAKLAKIFENQTEDQP